MTAFAVFIIKMWLASASIASVWCVCRWRHIDSTVIPCTAILILCGAIRVMAP